MAIKSLAIALGVLAFASATQAALIVENSALFSDKFEGDNATGSPIASAAGGFTTAPSSDGDIMTYLTVAPAGGYFNAASLFNAAAPYATGWTVEMRVKVDAAATSGPLGDVLYVAGDGPSGAIAIIIGKNSVGTYTGGVQATGDNTDDFHTFRVAKAASSNTFYLWRDGVLISSSLPIDFAGDADLYFGDGGSAVDGQPYIDYFRWTLGAFAPPVPEPASVALLGIGGLMLLRRKR